MRVGSGERGDVDDVAAASFLHEGNGFVTTVENSEEIGFQHGAKIFTRHFFYGCEDSDARRC